MLAFAVPAIAVATRIALDEWDRRHGVRRIPPPPPPTRAAQARAQLSQVMDQAQAILARGETILTHPAVRGLVERARQAAMQAAKSGGRATRRAKRRFF